MASKRFSLSHSIVTLFFFLSGGLQYSCDFSNNFCTHLCLPNLDVDGHKCACPTGIALNPDQRSCPSGNTSYINLFLVHTVQSLIQCHLTICCSLRLLQFVECLWTYKIFLMFFLSLTSKIYAT